MAIPAAAVAAVNSCSELFAGGSMALALLGWTGVGVLCCLLEGLGAGLD